MTTPFKKSDGTLHSQYTSYVQHRGSIPLNWSQSSDNINPKPPIELNVVDPFFSAAALHFDHMFERYGTPCIVLNLVKARERIRRESILLEEFTQAIEYLNQFLPEDKRLKYIAWDMSRASKSRDQKVIETLETIAETSLQDTGFFHSGTPRMQSGVVRTNCIDCLDRTNAAQFVIGKHAFAVQLQVLGVVKDTRSVLYDCDAVNLLIEMYHDHGDTIALQYGGSNLVNRMETYRKINQWTSHSRDMIESIRRFYNNSFLDAQRQDAINLFLGNYLLEDGQPMLWELSNDYNLHHNNKACMQRRRHYQKWWTPSHLSAQGLEDCRGKEGFRDFYWQEYYRPNILSTLNKVYAHNVNCTLRYIPAKSLQDQRFEVSPFAVRSVQTDLLKRADPSAKSTEKDIK